jgi:hypothetical protein
MSQEWLNDKKQTMKRERNCALFIDSAQEKQYNLFCLQSLKTRFAPRQEGFSYGKNDKNK